MKLAECLCCGSASLNQILDWGSMPPANNYNIKETFPIKLNLCSECKHLQLDENVDPEILFKNYPYFSGTSKTSLDFFKGFAENALRYFPEAKNVLDIACNDGAQLDAFKELGLRTFGIDPAENLLSVSKSKDHLVHCGMFPDERMLKTTQDIITAQNVLAHVPSPLKFLHGCKEIMHEDSYLFVTASQANMITGIEFDTIYHEHISYFNTRSMEALVKRAGLTLVDVFTNPIHGTSYVFVIKINPEKDPVDVRKKLEESQGLHVEETYLKWVELCKEKAQRTKEIIEKYRDQGYRIVGCGAAAKGITFLNMSKTKMDFIVDTTPAKWYSSAAGAQIYPFEYLKSLTDEKCLFVVLAWNFDFEIKQNVLKYRNNEKDIFITTNEK
jgi:2-polyprenyl-3-methyl-5-hydroxy-6-metoxy-1,4-benzoquinol methylase